ncbi:MAG: N-acetylglucosaminyl-diphospho-decaprenol L-rhamnosyltransferase [Chlamydiia bacterium]|nr:N-acetylglucosaminyl-diphospho-decaprenol L-rhamnosyltransferase [Chlamydiia bacterium]
MGPIHIIIVNYNGTEDTRICVESVLQSDFSNFAITLVDNGSRDRSIETVAALSDKIDLIRCQENYGYAEGNNIGIKHSLAKGAQYIMVLNNDTKIPPSLLHTLYQKAKYNKKQVVGGIPLLMDHPDTIDHLGGIWNPWKARFDLISAHAPLSQVDLTPLDYIAGSMFFVHRQFFEDVGFFDPRFFLFFEEADLCCRAKRLDYTLTIEPKAQYLHKKSAAFGKSHPLKSYFFWRNRLLYIKKNTTLLKKIALRANLIHQTTKLITTFTLKKVISFVTKQTPKRMHRLACYRASILGVFDFHTRHLGQGRIATFW